MALAIGVALVIGGCGQDGGSGGPDAGGTGGGSLPFGASCERNSDCMTNACIQVSATRSVCSGSCEPGATPSTCPAGPSWMCLQPNETDTYLCACQSDFELEVCADGIDNDCNGSTDDCRECAGVLIPPDDESHCGACGRACIAGATCSAGECVCPDGSTDDCTRDPNAPECEDAQSCDDGITCTEDVCMRGRCVSTVVPARCAADEVCDLRRGGCVAGMPCADDPDCVDEDPCSTQLRCDPATRVCLWVPLDGDDDGQPPRVCGGTDCDDDDDRTFAGAAERCDGTDNSCNGVIDEVLPADACAPDQLCTAGECVCTVGLLECDGFCFDPSTEPLHCGSCDNTCQPGAVCERGSCVCPDTTTQCAGGCFDLQADDAHCGACDAACNPGFACDEGDCLDVDECDEGTDDCTERESCANTVGGFNCTCAAGWVTSTVGCVDVNECTLASDDCDPNATCTNTEGGFTCDCIDGYTGDGETCEDIDECEDIDCGSHGTCQNLGGSFTCSCDPGYSFDGVDDCMLVNACQAGELLPEQKWCASTCRTLATDNNHCGDCGIVCTGGFCDAGDCACVDTALTHCGAAGCRNLLSDALHCGACNDPCPTGAGCVGGDCFCPMNSQVCGTACVAFGTVTNCLDCGDACPAGATCQVGGCTCPGGTPTVCSNTCVNTQTNLSHCGACGDPCPSGTVSCTGGACVCPMGMTECSNRCANLLEDEGHCGMCEDACSVVCSAGGCETATQVATSLNASCARLSDGTVRCWGTDASGVLGNGATSTVQVTPVTVLGLSGATQVAMGAYHACAITSADALYCWGENGSYQTLQSTTVDQASAVLARSGVTDVALGADHTCVQLTSGAIECVGQDSQGLHGDGDTVTASNTWSGPALGTLSDVDQLVSGAYHVCARKAGLVYCWGSNTYGQIGNGVTGTNVTAPIEVVGLSGIDEITAGDYHTCARDGGTVYCWGRNDSYQLGLSGTSSHPFATSLSSVTTAAAIDGGALHTCVKLVAGDVQCWGTHLDSRIGSNPGSPTFNPVTVIGGASLTQLSAGGLHTCALVSGGDLRCWGDGGSRANGTTVDTATPTDLTW